MTRFIELETERRCTHKPPGAIFQIVFQMNVSTGNTPDLWLAVQKVQKRKLSRNIMRLATFHNRPSHILRIAYGSVVNDVIDVFHLIAGKDRYPRQVMNVLALSRK